MTAARGLGEGEPKAILDEGDATVRPRLRATDDPSAASVRDTIQLHL